MFNSNIYTEHLRSSTNSAVIFYHGFPGDQKNEDIARALNELGYNIHLMHYEGLGKSQGKFNFQNAIQDAQKFYEYLKPKYDKLSIVGYSFGGHVTLQLLKKHCPTKVILLAPFCAPIESPELEELLNHFINGPFGKHHTYDEILKEISELNFDWSSSILTNTDIIYGSKDTITKPETALSLKENAIKLDATHDFEDRKAITKEVLNLFLN